MPEMKLTIRKPDDWHLHLRDGAMLKAVMPFTAKHFGRAILMPNLVPPVMTTKDAVAYRERALAARPPGSTFTPLMTCYLRDDTDPDDVERGFRDGVFTGVKLYPAHATTNSAAGVTDLKKAYRVLEPWKRSTCRSSCMARMSTPTSTFSTARPSSSSAS
jgi:dihydroorotase